MSNLKKQAVSGVVWTFAQQFSVQIINFLVQIILARLLMPADFGMVAMLIVFINMGQMLMDGGMTSSLIRTKNPDQLDYSTVFMTNMIMSGGVYVIIFASAPLVASFYDLPLLKSILRVFALTFVIRALVAVHVAKLTKEMNFKTQMKLQVPSTIIGAIVGVAMAYNGFGVWSLVGLNLVQTFVFTLQNWLFIKWRPSLIFNKRRFKYHFHFGYKLTLSGLLDTIYNDAYRIIIGKFFSPAQVGYFNQAETMRLFPVQQIGSVMGKVTYPLFANIKEDEKLRVTYRITMKLVLFVVLPAMLILIIIAKEGFLLLFGEKWLPAVPYFQILAIASIIRPISSYNLNILKVKGRSDLFLKVEVLKKVIGVIVIAISLPFGIMGLVYSLTGVSFLFTAINMVFCGKLINYSIFSQIKDLSYLFGIGIVTFFLTYLIYTGFLKNNYTDILVIFGVSIVYMTLYCFFIWFLERGLVKQLISIFKK